MEILLLGAGCHLSDISMVTGWEQLQDMDVHLKFPYEDQLSENDLKDSVWKRLQALDSKVLEQLEHRRDCYWSGDWGGRKVLVLDTRQYS